MGKAHKHAKSASPSDLFQRARRSLEKGDFKQAYKDAKVCYQQAPSSEHRQFLERTWLARVQALCRSGFEADSRQTVQGLLDFGVTDSEVQQQLPTILLAVGLFDRAVSGRGAAPVEVDPALLASAADRAVLKPADAARSLPGIREGAARVRAALEALYQADESRALAELKDVPRHSPFADWKLFVRGLAAYYREDQAEMRANWERLDRARVAASIASPLASLADPDRGDPEQRLQQAIRVLEKGLFGESLAACLAPLRTRFAKDQRKDLLLSLRQSQATLRRAAPGLLQRIERMLADLFVRKGDKRALDALIAQADPPPLDPRWNRTRALFWEHPHARDVSRADQHWKAYILDLHRLAALTPEERSLAEALVWERIGQLYAAENDDDWSDEYEEDEDDDDFDGDEDDQGEAIPRNREEAIRSFREAIRVAPHLLSAHRNLVRACTDAGQPDQAAEANRRLVERFPDDYDALTALYNHHMRRDEPLAAREYALRARRLKPANKLTLQMVWGAHLGSARHYALHGEWERGREEVAAAEALAPQPYELFHLLARKAIFEFKAGNRPAFSILSEEAKASVEGPAPVLLLMAAEAVRFDLPFTSVVEFDDRWIASLKRKRLGRSAGRMCRIMTAYLVNDVDYEGRGKHLDQLIGYLGKCTRLRWEADDLRDACYFLITTSAKDDRPLEQVLLDKLVRRGLKTCRESPVFPLLAGNQEVNKGPVRCNRRYATRCFQQAVALAKKSGRPEDAEIGREAQTKLDLLAELGMPSVGPFRGPPPGFFDRGHAHEEDEEADGSGMKGAFGTFMRMCRSLGVAPEEILRDLEDKLPPELAEMLSDLPSESGEKAKRKVRR